MAELKRNFIAGRMNKSVDNRLIPDGEYIDALNCRLGSSEGSDIGALENSKGNVKATTLIYVDGTPLSANARTIGKFADDANETMYWFVHDPSFPVGATGKLDLIVSFNEATDILTYHVISIDNGGGSETTLNFNPRYLITGVNLVDSNSEGLLFWTDDYNQPRFINVTRTYNPPIADIDQFTAESILVIKKPPVTAPGISLVQSGNEENFLEERFICFGYRYKYADNEYSATSQFSEPAFLPSPFKFSTDSFVNDGMINSNNAVNVTFDTGGPLVVAVDLLFKEASSNIIKVIEKLNKAELGYPDNTIQSYTFSNSKIFTILPEAELLRLYDNVPRLAKAQTIMGNRLVYGNYIEGYDLIDENGDPIRYDYVASHESAMINNVEVPDTLGDGGYLYGSVTTILDSVLLIDLSDVMNTTGLKAQSQINVTILVSHDSFAGNTPYPTTVAQNVQVDWTFTLPVDYPDVYTMATSIEFQEAVGTALPGGSIKPVYDPILPTSCAGFTFTDLFNCAMPNTLAVPSPGPAAVFKFRSGITGPNQPIAVIAVPGSDIIGFQVPAMHYVQDPATYTPLMFEVYEFYNIVNADASFVSNGGGKSLHSNRCYDVGIVYMDEYGRASTALVSRMNTINVPCSYCNKQNKLHVTIPATQRAPYWATRYKFVVKADREGYETIYANIFFIDPETNNAYILLEGENARKVESGDRLIVKSDSTGPAIQCIYTTVLEKEAKQRGFIEIPSVLNPTQPIEAPAGVYMKVSPNNLSLIFDELSYIAPGSITGVSGNAGEGPVVWYPVNRFDTVSSAWVDYDIPAGSRIVFEFKFKRNGSGDGNNNCEKRIYTLTATMISSADYANFEDWFNGDNVQGILNDGFQDVGGTGCSINNSYNNVPIVAPILGPTGRTSSANLCINQYRFQRDPGSNQLAFVVIGTIACGSNKNRQSTVSINITVFRADSTLIFETEPGDTLPDVFFENHLSFGIGPNGEHLGNIQDQDFMTNAPAIVDTEFFNCFAYGNGAESYKVRDSVVGKTFNLGNRVTSVAAQDYKEADRFADLTYSGVYNDESNVNRLNAFNLGLLNFKSLEDSFGEVTLIDGRETDILVLQEDKISYVLAGKNLLSDSAAGGAITSVPEVLGTQIARIERYGNSFNPESFAKWGPDKFFTDAKRGAVIQLKGDSVSNEQLRVISDQGMRPWFRDMFIAALNTQKIGGYDPYMTEYVLSSNEIPLPEPSECIGCNSIRSVRITDIEAPVEYCVDLGVLIGDFSVSWNILSLSVGCEINVSATYDGITTTSGSVDVDGSFTLNKPSITPTTVTIGIATTSPGTAVVEMIVSCPQPTELTIVEVVVTDDFDYGKFIHAQYKYINGAYISPTSSNMVTFQSSPYSPLVSRYNSSTGFQGSGSFPLDGSTVQIISNKIGFDDFDFNTASNKFMWLRSNVLYANTLVDISALLAAATTAAPTLGSSPTFYADFTMPVSADQYLYLIWDLRAPTEVQLCFEKGNTEGALEAACCECNTCFEECSTYEITNVTDPGANFQYTECGTEEVKIVAAPIGVTTVCSSTFPIPFRDADLGIVKTQCGCI